MPTRTWSSPAALRREPTGSRTNLQLPPMVTGDPHIDASLTRLPTQLAEALPAFEQSPFIREVYGELFVDVYATMLRHELELFARYVTDWERAPLPRGHVASSSRDDRLDLRRLGSRDAPRVVAPGALDHAE